MRKSVIKKAIERLAMAITHKLNAAQGVGALSSNTTGLNNTAQGVNALGFNTTGFSNTAHGAYALQSNTEGHSNFAQGAGSLYSNTAGYYNSAQGLNAGRYIADGSTANQTSNTSTYIGADTKALANGDSNETVIGYGATGNGSNTVTIGNDSVVKTILKGKIEIKKTKIEETPENGTIEFDGTNLYFTAGGVRRIVFLIK